jgi:hypothetical protein
MGSPRHRSPPFPFITLSKAIERTQQLWDEKRRRGSGIRAGRKPTYDSLLSIEELASAWRYGAKSGGLTQTAAALIQFGLLSPKGGLSLRRFEFTSISLGLMKGSYQQRNAHRFIRKAALMPKLHRELFPKFGGAQNVDDDAIQRYLVEGRALAHKAAFSADSARNLINEYRATMNAAELSEIEPCSLPSDVFEEDNDGRFFDFGAPSNPRPPLGFAPPEGPDLMKAGVSRDGEDPHVMVPARSKNVKRVWDQGILSPTAEYQLLVSGEIGEKEIEVLIRRLQITKESLTRKDK